MNQWTSQSGRPDETTETPKQQKGRTRRVLSDENKQPCYLHRMGALCVDVNVENLFKSIARVYVYARNENVFKSENFCVFFQ